MENYLRRLAIKWENLSRMFVQIEEFQSNVDEMNKTPSFDTENG